MRANCLRCLTRAEGSSRPKCLCHDHEVASELVSTARAATALNIARSTLSRWASDGTVTPAQRTIGGHLRWDLEDLRRQIDEATRRTS